MWNTVVGVIRDEIKMRESLGHTLLLLFTPKTKENILEMAPPLPSTVWEEDAKPDSLRSVNKELLKLAHPWIFS